MAMGSQTAAAAGSGVGSMTFTLSNEERARVVKLLMFNTRIAYQFNSEAAARSMLEPAIFVDVTGNDCEILIMEWLQLAAMVKRNTANALDLTADHDTDSFDPAYGLITLVVVDGIGIDIYTVPNPRVPKNLKLWPWREDLMRSRRKGGAA
jgi:hypothetical protein